MESYKKFWLRVYKTLRRYNLEKFTDDVTQELLILTNFEMDIEYFKRRVIDAVRLTLGDSRTKKSKNRTSSAFLDGLTVNETQFEDLLEKELLTEYSSKVANLTDEKVIALKLLGYNNREVAKILNVTETRIGHRLKRVRGKIT